MLGAALCVKKKKYFCASAECMALNLRFELENILLQTFCFPCK